MPRVLGALSLLLFDLFDNNALPCLIYSDEFGRCSGHGGGAPLHDAAYYDSPKVCRVLLGEEIHDDENKKIECEIEIRDDENRTPLHRAARQGCHQAVQVLLEHGAEIDAEYEQSDDEDARPGWDYPATALGVAMRHNRFQVVEVLTQHNPSVFEAYAEFYKAPHLRSGNATRAAKITTYTEEGNRETLQTSGLSYFECAEIRREYITENEVFKWATTTK